MYELTNEKLLALQGGAKAVAGGGACSIFLMEMTIVLGVGVIMGGAGAAFSLGFVVGALSSDSNPC
jgi:hypothetical protein